MNQNVAVNLNTTSVQDILADLGKPSRIFYKEEDKMKIHSISDNVKPNIANPIESKTVAPNNVDDKDKGKKSYTSWVYIIKTL